MNFINNPTKGEAMSTRVHLKNNKRPLIRAQCLSCGKLILSKTSETIKRDLLVNPDILKQIGSVLMCRKCFRMHAFKRLLNVLRNLIAAYQETEKV